MKKILIALALVITGVASYYYIKSNKQEASGEALASVVVPQLSPIAIEGEALFADNCADCHGVNAAGVDGAGPPLVHIIYEPNHHGDDSFKLAVKNGVRSHHWPFGNMEPREDASAEQVEKITTYIRELQRANGIN